MTKKRMLLLVGLVAVIALVSFFLYRQWGPIAQQRSDHTCMVNMLFLTHDAERVVHETGELPFDADEAEAVLAQLFSSEWPRRCRSAGLSGNSDYGYEVANRPPDDWKRLQESEFGTGLRVTSGWPFLWCRGSPHDGHSWAVAFDGGTVGHRRLSTVQVRDLNRLADGLVRVGNLEQRLSHSGFFEWGFQSRVESIIRQAFLSVS